ncbi:helix-turn-helix domain-containing protein [Myroides odoratimimus]|uniref:helix-turn-helix domain-containing protein n=1 Tax=Myroides odoratimimus TaxID=76832 RepID=UPI00046A6665|nr:helix-turn-helix transcriptional regulator [Myroides odoratimimus]
MIQKERCVQFADNIRFIRAKNNLSQQKVADELNITRARYSKYEENMAEPPLLLLIKISSYFNLSIDTLLTKDIRKL